MLNAFFDDARPGLARLFAAACTVLGLWGLTANAGLAARPAGSQTASPARSVALTADDEKSIRAVVQGQLAALAKDDAARAFSFAAPNVREAVGSAPRFLEMVQRGYPVVYRPSSVAYLKAEGNNDQAIQRVQMIDRSGEPWLATYTLQRQKSRMWRITGCTVVENRGRMT